MKKLYQRKILNRLHGPTEVDVKNEVEHIGLLHVAPLEFYQAFVFVLLFELT